MSGKITRATGTNRLKKAPTPRKLPGKPPEPLRRDTLFPPLLEEGAEGPAVQALQLLLLREGWRGTTGRKAQPQRADGIFSPATTAGVRWLQKDLLGLENQAITGKFDQATREAYAKQYGVDVNEIPYYKGASHGTTWYQDGVDQGVWPVGTNKSRPPILDDDDEDLLDDDGYPKDGDEDPSGEEEAFPDR